MYLQPSVIPENFHPTVVVPPHVSIMRNIVSPISYVHVSMELLIQMDKRKQCFFLKIGAISCFPKQKFKHFLLFHAVMYYNFKSSTNETLIWLRGIRDK